MSRRGNVYRLLPTATLDNARHPATCLTPVKSSMPGHHVHVPWQGYCDCIGLQQSAHDGLLLVSFWALSQGHCKSGDVQTGEWVFCRPKTCRPELQTVGILQTAKLSQLWYGQSLLLSCNWAWCPSRLDCPNLQASLRMTDCNISLT